MASDEVSLEVWFAPESSTDEGRFLALGPMDEDALGMVFVRTAFYAHANAFGSIHGNKPGLQSRLGLISESPTHIVFTRDADGLQTLYKDGIPVARNMVPGELDAWPGGPLHLGEQQDGSERMAGDMYLLAVFCQALSEKRVVRHYQAGY